MAKKANGAGSAFIFLAMAAVFILIAAVNIGFLLYPFVVGAAYAYGRFAPKQPDIPEPSDYDNALDRFAIAIALTDRAKRIIDRDNLTARAELEGLRATKGSGYTRYDTRKAKASEINKELDVVEHEIECCEESIFRIRQNRYRTFPNWQKISDNWIRRKSIGSAAAVSAICAFTAFGVLSFIGRNAKYLYDSIIMPFEYGSSYIFFHKDYPVLTTILFAAAVAGYAGLAVGYFQGRKKFPYMIDRVVLTGWLSMEENWHPASSYDSFQVYREPVIEDASDGRFSAGDSGAGEHWADVLGVAEDATPDEVKAAYRAIIKSYHSDRVVGLGPKLQALAEDETKRINLAYEQAKAAKGI